MNNSKTEHELSFEYSKITENLFLGTSLCCQAHFEEELLDKGISVDVSLQGENVDTPFGVELFSWIPVMDNTAPTLDQINLGINIIDDAIKKDKKVYVHCEFGHGRAPTLIIAYLLKYGKVGESVQEVLEYVKSKRSVIHPNDSQISALYEFQSRLD